MRRCRWRQPREPRDVRSAQRALWTGLRLRRPPRGSTRRARQLLDRRKTCEASVGDFTIDDGTRQLLRGDREVHLSPKAFDLLATLAAARPRALSKTELHARLWPDTFVSDANLAMLVAEVRSAIGDDARRAQFVRTVQRYGYAFHGNATELPGAVASEAGSTFKRWLLAPLKQIPLIAGENLAGRDPGVQVWLDSASVSRVMHGSRLRAVG